MKLYHADAFDVLPKLDAVGIEMTEDNYKIAAARIAELLPRPPQ